MKMTREEAIRNFRKHWASLAISGSEDKNEFLRRHNYPSMLNDCFLCEFTMTDVGCDRCPVEWEKTRRMGITPCTQSFYGDWVYSTTPEERKRLAAIIRDLPEKKEVKLKPKFSVGDKVYPVSKTVPGFVRDIEFDIHWRKSKERGYFFAVGIEESLTKSAGKTVYMCSYHKDATTGNYFFESDLRPYVEPEKKREPAFKVGDKVKVVKETHGWGKVGPGDIGVITKVLDGLLYFADFPAQKSWHGKEECFELATSINRCPEDKTVTVQTITIEFKGPKTICTIENQFGTFKGRAKCHPTDQWNEKTGANLALGRAVEKFDEYELDA